MRAAPALGSAFWGRALVAVEWRKLCFVRYAVDPSVLAGHRPSALSLDVHDGRAWLSLALWSAAYPQVFGVDLPRHPVSTEIALRYDVLEGPRRGTVTLFEDSSSPFAALAARALFREPVRHTHARSSCDQEGDAIVCSYEAERDGRRCLSVRVRADREALPTEPESPVYPVLQRLFGYTRSARGDLLRYDLEHPVWETYTVREHALEIDFERLYGPDWKFLGDMRPAAVILAEGSSVRASLPE